MITITKNLRNWRKARNITEPNTKVFTANIIEELLEIYYCDKDLIKNIQKDIMSKYFSENPISELNTIDAIQDMQVFSVNETELMGYNNEYANTEVIKHISSRKQSPIQKEQWDKFGSSGKWLKDTNQPLSEIYQPNYEKCKVL